MLIEVVCNRSCDEIESNTDDGINSNTSSIEDDYNVFSKEKIDENIEVTQDSNGDDIITEIKIIKVCANSNQLLGFLEKQTILLYPMLLEKILKVQIV